VRHGKLSPVFFGSALNNFGIEPFLEHFLKMTTSPLPRMASGEHIDPFDEGFSAFVFKIQANMNKAHRDRIAFMRICSGKFERGKEYYHVQGDKSFRLSQPQQMMAAEREVIEEAYAGDIIGVFDPGVFSIGDTVCEKGKKTKFEGIPVFAPEHFSMVEQVDSMKRKQFAKGMNQIAQEGAIQIFFEPNSGLERVIVGVVGVLQFEVLEYRIKNEYGCDLRRSPLPYQQIRWIEGDIDPKTLKLSHDTKWVQDFRGKNLLIFTSEWAIRWVLEDNPDLKLSEFSRNEEKEY
jgi:peptide chain release factor 3